MTTSAPCPTCGKETVKVAYKGERVHVATGRMECKK